jgi:predicted nucleotidyltransferase
MGLLASKLKNRNLIPTELNQLTKLVRERILSISSPTKIYIFGSYAQGKIRETSDVDIAILFDDSDYLKKNKKLILNSKLFLDYSTDLLFYTTSEFEKKSALGGVCAEIANKGIVIYDQRTEI